MKTMFRTIALAAIASLALTGCIKHEPYGHHTEPGPDNGGHHGGNTEEKVVLNERSDCERVQPPETLMLTSWLKSIWPSVPM